MSLRARIIEVLEGDGWTVAPWMLMYSGGSPNRRAPEEQAFHVCVRPSGGERGRESVAVWLVGPPVAASSDPDTGLAEAGGSLYALLRQHLTEVSWTAPAEIAWPKSALRVGAVFGGTGLDVVAR